MSNIKNTLKSILKFLLRNIPTKQVKLEIVQLPPSDLLKGKTAIVTGGTSGIGYEIAKTFANAGCNVIITSRSELRLFETLSQLKQEISGSGQTLGLVLDNEKTDTFNLFLKGALDLLKAKAQEPRIDILVNNAGILGGKLSALNDQEFDRVINTNMKGTFFLSYTIAEYMKENKIKGNILNIASSSSLRPAISAYTLSKWGIRAMTLGMAKSYANYGITINGLAPGPTATPMLMVNKTQNLNNKDIPLGRFILPEEIANMALFLVSSMGKAIIGDTIFMTGGAGILTYDDYDYEL